MASGSITLIERGKVETVAYFIFLGSKITADSNCSHEIKRLLLLGRKAMTNLDSILKSRDIILLTKVHIVKAMLFPVVMCRCESWTIKMAVKVKAKIAQSCPTLCDPMDYTVQLSRLEYWSGSPFLLSTKELTLSNCGAGEDS